MASPIVAWIVCGQILWQCIPSFSGAATGPRVFTMGATWRTRGALPQMPKDASAGVSYARPTDSKTLAAVQTGDEITLDVPARKIVLRLDDNEIQRRLAERPPAPQRYKRGYGKLFMEQVTQAHEGCDFRFLHHDEGDA